MRSSAGAAILGGGLALLLLAAGIGLLYTGVIEVPTDDPAPSRLLVIATAPDDVSVNAPFAFVMEVGRTSATLLDPGAPVVVSGTSANSARDAYPFVGGHGVARALAVQTGGQTLPWVVLPQESWAAFIDDFGGLEIDVPQAISAYRDGSLVVVPQGQQRLTGEQAVALASALGHIDNDQVRAGLNSQLSAGISAVVSARQAEIPELVAQGRATSSLEPDALERFTAE